MENDLVDPLEYCSFSTEQARAYVRIGNVEAAKKIYEETIARCVEALTTHECQCDCDEDVDGREKKQMMANLDSCLMKPSETLTWDCVIGNDLAKQALEEAILLPDQYAELWKEHKLKSWDGILLYGVPGCGKTEMAHTAASIAKAPFFVVRASDLKSMWTGRSERYVKLLFQKAREHPLCVLFFDEIDSLAHKRTTGSNHGSDGILTELLNEMNFKGNGNTSRIVVIGATNVPSSLDSGIIRRFQKRIHVKMPEVRDRSNIFRRKIGMSILKTAFTEQDYLEVGRATEGFSGSDIDTVCRDLEMEGLRRLDKGSTRYYKDYVVNLDEVLRVIDRTPRSVTQSMIEECNDFEGDDCSAIVVSKAAARLPVRKRLRNAVMKLFL